MAHAEAEDLESTAAEVEEVEDVGGVMIAAIEVGIATSISEIAGIRHSEMSAAVSANGVTEIVKTSGAGAHHPAVGRHLDETFEI